MTLRLRFWGTRGSIPSPGAHTVRYGGNTPCVEVRTETDALVILDAGTGMRELGLSLLSQRGNGGIMADIFLTHAHWDHVQGIPFFTPIFQPGNRFTICAPKDTDGGIDHVLRDQMAPAVFPVGFDQLKAQIEFCSIGEAERKSGNGYEVTAFAVQHPGGALGYRFSGRSEAERSFVYISDNELGSDGGGSYSTRAGWRQELVEFIRGAALLVHDATYTTEEYETHRGWGQSTAEDAVALALDAEVEELILFHHKPERSDDELDQRVAACRALVATRGGTLSVSAAAEGMIVSV
jgi:phosphoribosyl 1,2-cyclic phosphodiesterase